MSDQGAEMDYNGEDEKNQGNQVCADGEAVSNGVLGQQSCGEEALAPLPAPVPRRKRGRPKGPGRQRRVIGDRLKAQVVALRARGIPSAIVGRELGISTSAVTRITSHFNGLLQELNSVQEFREKKGEILEAGQIRVLKSLLDEAKISSANLTQTARAFEVLHKASRLEANQSTDNRAISLRFTGALGDDE